MRTLLLLPVILISSFCHGQNYQTILSNQINYFAEDDLEYILATRTDSIEISGSDSIFHSFKTLRWNDTATVTLCEFIKSAPWYGQKVIIQDDGTNLFFNKKYDTIRIETQAMLNDTFTVYNYPSGEWIKGWISQHDTMTIFGNPDSIKSIQLFSNNPSFAFSDSMINISKEYGFISILPFYAFPHAYQFNKPKNYGSSYDSIQSPMKLVGTEFPRQGITKRTKGEIYNIELSDVIKHSSNISYWGVSWYSGSYKYEIELIDKEIWGGDSLYLKFEKKYHEITVYPDNTIQSFINSYTYTKKIYDLDDFLNPYLPEEIYFDGPNSPYVHKNWMAVHQCGRIAEGFSFEELNYETDSTGNPIDTSLCLTYGYFGISGTYGYYEGLGGPFTINDNKYISGFPETHTGGITYYDAQGQTCGNFWAVGLEEQVEQTIDLYPNPANDQITVDVSNLNAIVIVTIVDLSGKVVLSDENVTGSVQFDVGILKSGAYIVLVESDGIVCQKKLVIH